ncbi:hypothetical protein KBY72_11895 [Cyanobium sp. BA5m-21]|nr:hypothetical protein [Cyanobium sp. BA5m-21]MCP9903752.1 hypothetical protein [Cyanobium sp. BA5m-10]MCP9907869.1 hypothetical protein [Cyanobium sp. BA5m-21]
MAIQRTRLLASFLAINSFFWFADPTLGLAGGVGGQLVRSLMLVVTAAWLARGWRRSSDDYRRESLSVSLRRQLEPLEPQLQAALDGRSLAQLSAAEVFTLAKALPAHLRTNTLTIYRNVLEDMFSSGRLDRASAFLQLEELRGVLGLQEADHHEALRELALRDPGLLELDARQRQARDLRQAAATDAVADLLDLGTGSPAQFDALTPRQRQRLERLRQESGLDDAAWATVLAAFDPLASLRSPLIARNLELLALLIESRRSVAQACEHELLMQPLLVALDLQIVSVLVNLAPAMAKGLEDELQLPERLLRQLPGSVEIRLDLRGIRLPAADPGSESSEAETALAPPPLDGVLQELWQDPDPLTAAWALWMLRRRNPELASSVFRQPRLGLPSSKQSALLLSQIDQPGISVTALETRLLEILSLDASASQCSPAALLDRASTSAV